MKLLFVRFSSLPKFIPDLLLNGKFQFKIEYFLQNEDFLFKTTKFTQKNSDKRENNVTKSIPISLFQIEHCHD